LANEVQRTREALGYRLGDIRKDARVSGRQLAALAGWHFTKVSKIEHGRSMPSQADIELWCFHCGAESQIADLIATARGIEKMYVELKRLLRAGTARYQQELLDEETRTGHFRIFDLAIIPGALQTPGYATVRLSEFADMVGIPADIPATVAVRMERARLLLSGERLFHVVLGEHALHAALADRGVMQDQLHHLLEISSLPRLRLGVLPTLVRHYMPVCGFWIFDDREVQIETYSAAVRITQPREIAMYAKAFEHYSRRAVYGPQARELISRAIAGRARNLSRATLGNFLNPRWSFPYPGSTFRGKPKPAARTARCESASRNLACRQGPWLPQRFRARDCYPSLGVIGGLAQQVPPSSTRDDSPGGPAMPRNDEGTSRTGFSRCLMEGRSERGGIRGQDLGG
jgi:transcriptional regulator with XRE-family HTH domain